jgi:uncharacterized SAM-binding protein YcdF (DUF218 family)
MGKLARRVFGILISVFILVVFVFLLEGEKFLCIKNDEPSVNTDAVVILAGGPHEDVMRVKEGIDLFRRGKVKYIIFPSRHKVFTWSWVSKNYRITDKIPGYKVIIGTDNPQDHQITSNYGGTYNEALKTVKIMQKHQLGSAIIVSSCYHMRRAKMAFESCRRDGQPTFFYHPVQNFDQSNRVWWLDIHYVDKVLDEYKKLIAAYFIY